MVIYFFLLIHFLVVKDYELPKSTNHILSVPLNILVLFEYAPKKMSYVVSTPLFGFRNFGFDSH